MRERPVAGLARDLRSAACAVWLRRAKEDGGQTSDVRDQRNRPYLPLIPQRSVSRTNSATDCTLIFCITRARWTLTVCWTVPRSAAICLFNLPLTTYLSTSRSRGVSLARRV